MRQEMGKTLSMKDLNRQKADEVGQEEKRQGQPRQTRDV
jgi:hypothetical protein